MISKGIADINPQLEENNSFCKKNTPSGFRP